VICQNGSVFSGGDDFAVLLYRPLFASFSTTSSAVSPKTSSSALQRILKRVASRSDYSNRPGSSLIVPAVVGTGILLLLITVAFYWKWNDVNSKTSDTDSIKKSDVTDSDITNINTMLKTLVPTSMGLSVHAQLEINPAYIAKEILLAKGGGGQLFKAKLMDPTLIALHRSTVVQKLVNLSGKAALESFNQEVAIMTMLSTFPHFCKFIGYTVNPMSMVLKFYPAGSLDGWITRTVYGKRVAFQIIHEISKAVSTMHSHFLAHCDLKTQNVLVESEGDKLNFCLTDFGITQILSEKVLATKLFRITNIRGLSIHYASPEAFTSFRTKNYSKADFKMYDIYSLACIITEALTRKAPWS
jgi:tRNA A-37 threonylcarbamoyl transferase component Bud32